MSNPSDSDTAIESIRQEIQSFKTKLLQYHVLEEELIANRVYENAKGRLKSWFTFGGLAIFVLGGFGIKEIFDYYKSLQARVDEMVEPVVEAIIAERLSEAAIVARLEAELEERLSGVDERIVTLDESQSRLASSLSEVRISVKDMESCTYFDVEGDSWKTRNTCNQAVDLRFMERGQAPIERTLQPGENFEPGANDGADFVFTTCPVGYVSSLPISEENWEAIGNSIYTCISD